MKKIILSLMLLIVFFDLKAKDIEYIFPNPNTKHHNTHTEIILTFDEEISLKNINKNAINLFGTKSGKHTYDIKVANNNKTLIIKPHNEFTTSEKVNVNIGSLFLYENFKNLEFTFETINHKINKQINDKSAIVENESAYIQVLNEDKVNFFKDYKEALNNDELPADFPTLDIKVNNNPKDGFMLVAPRVANNSGFGNYLIILDKNGVPVKFRPTTPNSFNFKQQDNGLYAVAETFGSHLGITGNGTRSIIRIFDKDLNLLESFQMGNGYIAGPHEFMIQPNGNFICVAQNPIPMDMSKIIEGGNPNAFIVSNVIQEFDKDKNCIFQWRAIDHIELTESYLKLTDPVISYAHINALEVDRDGNWLISPRHTASIMKINRLTGEIMWRFGGKKTDFTVIGDEKNGPEYFSYQHDIRRLKNGDITFFDNGNLKTPQYSRGVRYKLDEENKIATLVWQYRNTPDVYAGQQGSVQAFDDGSYLIGWGTATQANQVGLTELDSQGNKTFELNFPNNTSHYRVQKVPYPPCPAVANVMKEELLELNTYDFNEPGKKSGIKMTFNTLNSPVPYNIFYVRKYDCAPMNPEFLGMTPLIAAHRVEIEGVQITNFVATVELDMNEFQNSFDYDTPYVYFRPVVGMGSFQFVPATYNPDTKKLTFSLSQNGELVIGKSSNQLLTPIATLHSPADESVLDPESDIILEWSNNSNYTFNKVTLYEIGQTGERMVRVDTLTRELRYIIPANSISVDTRFAWKITPQFINSGVETEEWFFRTRPKFISMITPNGGEVVSNQGVNTIIRWEDNYFDTVKIELYRNGQLVKVIQDSVVSYTNNFLWNVTNDIEVGSDYKIKITSFNYGVVGESMDYFAISEINSIDEEVTNNTLIYPNPSNNRIFVELNDLNDDKLSDDKLSDFNFENIEKDNLAIFDILGNKINTINSNDIIINNNNIEINIQNLNIGVYILKLTNNLSNYNSNSPNFVEIGKFIKN